MAAIHNSGVASCLQNPAMVKGSLVIVVVLAIIATIAIAASAWANVQVASVFGSQGIARFSPFTIVAPFILVSLCVGLVRLFFLEKETPVAHLLTHSAAHMTPIAVPSVSIAAPMPGKISSFLVNEGDLVQVGTPLLVTEAMKMENTIRATQAGRVHFHAAPGSLLQQGDQLLTITPERV